jgi:Protein of unknown function (DUF4446)
LSSDTAALIAIAALVVGGLALLLAVWVLLRTRQLARMGKFRPQMPEDLQDTVERETERLDQLTLRVQDLNGRLPVVEGRSTVSLQRVGIVRFNPFADTGGQQSFAVALLDSRGSGFVISSLHSRQATRVYLKQVTDGKSETPLGDEEAQAIAQALAGGSPKS